MHAAHVDSMHRVKEGLNLLNVSIHSTPYLRGGSIHQSISNKQEKGETENFGKPHDMPKGSRR